MVAPFGTRLHVSGPDPAALAAALLPFGDRPGLVLSPGQPTLEDVFIHLMGGVRDQYAGPDGRGMPA